MFRFVLALAAVLAILYFRIRSEHFRPIYTPRPRSTLVIVCMTLSSDEINS